MATSIYVHVPFCISRCSYCNFYSGEQLSRMEGYPERILAEAGLRRPQFSDPFAATLYIGGGTPSLLGVERIARLIAGIKEIFPLVRDAEVTVEVNPSSALDFASLARAGANRVSIGVQALNDRNLTLLGRVHTGKEALNAVKEAVAAGLNVSADLIYGYEGLTVADIAASADALIDAGVVHLSAYSLEVGEKCAVRKANEEEEQAQADALLERLESRGFLHYEVSNYALPGRESRHNTGYWEGWGYMGLGPGAHGYLPHLGINGERYSNNPDLTSWRKAIDTGALPPCETERPSDSEAALERLFLAFRRSAPFDIRSLGEISGLEAALSRLIESGDLVNAGEFSYRVTSQGLRRADGLACHIHSLIFP